MKKLKSFFESQKMFVGGKEVRLSIHYFTKELKTSIHFVSPIATSSKISSTRAEIIVILSQNTTEHTE